MVNALTPKHLAEKRAGFHEFVLMVNVVSSNIFYKSIWSSYIQRRLVYDV
ncbi:hypothetical protein SA21196_1845 [Staphylococcus aureus subsp. aureus 21196]|nr:hypothetical protein SA21196_1845 [Staphylococcus aureus subsp. aureus 21196]